MEKKCLKCNIAVQINSEHQIIRNLFMISEVMCERCAKKAYYLQNPKPIPTES